MVLAQIAQRAKLNRTLRDDRKEKLRSESQRTLVDNLLRNQNAMLQRDHPQLEWTLAGLECTVREKRWLAEETRRIKVILKTQWVPGSRPGGPVGRDRAWVQLGRGDPAGVGMHHGVGIGKGGNVRAGQGQVHATEGLHIGGGDINRTPYAKVHAYRKSNAHRPRTRAGPPRPRPPIVVRQPQLVFVREGGKGKIKRNHEEDSGCRRYLGNDIRGSQYYLERRDPGSYRRSMSHDTSSRSFSPVPSSYPRPHHPLLQPATVIRPGGSNIPLPPEPIHMRAVPGNREEMTHEEEEQIIEDLFSEWEELTDKKGKKKKSRKRAKYYHRAERHDVPDANSDVGISRMMMREIENESRNRAIMEQIRIRREEEIRTRRENPIQFMMSGGFGPTPRDRNIQIMHSYTSR